MLPFLYIWWKLTKVEEAFNDLKAGTDHEVMKKRYSAGTLSRAYSLYLGWAKDRSKKVRASIKTLEIKEKELQGTAERLEKDAKEHNRIVGVMKKQISALENHEQEIMDKKAELKNRLDSLEKSLNELDKRGVTEEALARINSIDFGDGDEFIKRLDTLEAYTQLEEDTVKMQSEYTRYDLMASEREAWYKDVSAKVRSKENELDEVKRKHFLFEEAIEIMIGFRKAGYDKETLLSLKEAFKALEIKGKSDVSVKRLLDGLRNYKNLYKVESTLRTKRQKLTEIEKELEKAQGSLSAFQESILKELKGTGKEFTNSINSMYKEYSKGFEELQKIYMHEAKALFEYEEEEFDKFSLKAKEVLEKAGMVYSREMSGLKSDFESGVNSILSNAKKLREKQ